jgi:hypothetical protein
VVRATLFAEHGHLELGQPGRAGHQFAAGDLLPGYHLAVGAGAGCLLLAALIAAAGFRGAALPAAPASREQQPERAR